MRFKKEHWITGTTKESLRKMLENHYIEHQLSYYGGWNESHIRYFLELEAHLYTEPKAMQWHINTCIGIIAEDCTE